MKLPNQLMVVGALEESDDDSRFDSLFSGQIAKDQSGKFTLARYSTYTRQQKERKLNI